ncbi:MAG: ABC transporter permease [Candidatus Cloacimonetes bacterium]|nr:ABC transporter permease [Candidatus Cloacimonadota bacterium]
MNQIILMKDIRLMLKDLKFQIFFLILVALFILSAISSAVTYQNLSEEFQTDLNRHNERVADGESMQMIRMLQGNLLQVVSRPSPAVLFSSYQTYPDKISVGILFYTPYFDNYGTSTREVFRLNWYFILGILSGFFMLILSFEAISHEKRAGTLRLMSVYGFKRQMILWHKYISYMLLYLIIIVPPALVSLLLFFAMTGTWSMVFMWKFLLILLISVPFASFFVWLGTLISMVKNYRNAIVMVVFIWLFFVIIVPQSANIIAKQLSPLKTSIEYNEMWRQAYLEEYQIWGDEYGMQVHSNGALHDGIRARAFHACDEKAALTKLIEIDDSDRQTRMIQNISAISPFVQFEKISEVIFDKGYYLLNFQQETAKRSINQITNLMIEQDSRDETSLHLFYGHANSDRYVLSELGQIPFSEQLFEHPELLFVSEIETEDSWTKAMRILLRLLPILILNLVLIVVSVVRFEKLDIR